MTPLNKIFCLPGMVVFLVLFAVSTACPQQSLTREESRSAQQEREKKGNIFNMIFGSAPGMPTQRGILIINAYHDENSNRKKEAQEKELRNEIVCRIDGIPYRIPAFIPALRLHEMYRVECDTAPDGDGFVPENPTTELFVQRKGQVFSVELPCKMLETIPNR
jgi:hypothetical protein